MKIKTLFKCIIVALFFCGGMRASAVTTSPKGQVTIRQVYDNQAVSGGNLVAYQVAQLEAEGQFSLLPHFSSLSGQVTLTEEAIYSQNRAYSQLFQEKLQGLEATQAVASISAEGAVFSDLTPGIYLFVQTQAPEGYAPLQPFLLTVPKDNNYILTATEKMSLPPKTPLPPKVVDQPKKMAGELPFTGQVWWPIYVLFGLGLVFFFIAYKWRRDDV